MQLSRRSLLLTATAPLLARSSKTAVSIRGEDFHLNGKPTYAGRTWKGIRIEGLLLNSRMVQGVFDDRNPRTVGRWAYPDTKRWDAERNTREFLAAMPVWRKHGLLSFAINMQGGSPQGYSQEQPWRTGGFEADGTPIPAYLDRLRRILDKADQLGMAPMLGFFYFGQDEALRDEAAVKNAADKMCDWIAAQGYRNLLIEVANECDVRRYDHDILKPSRIGELIERVRARKLLAGTSFGGGAIPNPEVIAASDFLLIHGNGVKEPERIEKMVLETRSRAGARKLPILFNEDDHFDFEKADNNFVRALKNRASWGYFDPDGYQCPPVNWGIDTDRKKEFFALVKEVRGA